MKIALRMMILGVALAVAAYMGCASALETLKLGAQVPEFKLKDQDGKEHSLADHQGQVMVLIFSSQQCPWSRGADPDIAALSQKYATKGVTFLGIDSNSATSVEDIKKHAEDNEIPFPILKDDQNKYADAVGAKQTPEIFIVGKDGKLAYHGAYDDRKNPNEKGATNYVGDALEALLADKEVITKEVKAWGCGIKRVA
ncbi:MAG: redoxin domain-containing protein [Candidatus Hydrogenedentes bacterium]|nr:redoxin domain-containing protein [Candidatus Hydrogenedentota bacterium]